MHKNKKVVLKKSSGLSARIKSSYSESNLAIAQVLITINDFHDFVNLIRSKINHKTNISSLNLKEKDKLRIGILALVRKFSLTPNWNSAIKEAVLTNKLSIPEKFYPIKLLSPGEKSGKNCVSLCLTHPLSSEDLKRWIVKNGSEIEEAISGLPNFKKNKVQQKTILRGQLVVFCKKKGMSSYKEILKCLQNEFENKPQFQELSEELNKIDDHDLRNSEIAFLELLKEYLP